MAYDVADVESVSECFFFVHTGADAPATRTWPEVPSPRVLVVAEPV